KGIFENLEVYGVSHGYEGLINNQIKRMELGDVRDMINRGGTKLYSARSEEFLTLAGQNKAVANLKNLGIEDQIVIGGDASYRGERRLSQLGIKTIPNQATIANYN